MHIVVVTVDLVPFVHVCVAYKAGLVRLKYTVVYKSVQSTCNMYMYVCMYVCMYRYNNVHERVDVCIIVQQIRVSS